MPKNFIASIFRIIDYSFLPMQLADEDHPPLISDRPIKIASIF